MIWPHEIVLYAWASGQLGLLWVATIAVFIAAAVAGCTAEANHQPKRQVSALRKQNASLKAQLREQRNRAIDAQIEQAQLLTELNRQCELNEHVIAERDEAHQDAEHWRQQALAVDLARRES